LFLSITTHTALVLSPSRNVQPVPKKADAKLVAKPVVAKPVAVVPKALAVKVAAVKPAGVKPAAKAQVKPAVKAATFMIDSALCANNSVLSLRTLMLSLKPP
jgi:hypothetical protein